ncbi:hypothetical protein PV646_41325 [Streptomyces sp. ID05-26A]|nr:hypothetical protein [Streptomyces sp. ID05-26A]
MAEMSLVTMRRDRDRDDDRDMIGHKIGNALVVHPRNALRNETRDLALGLAADPEHELVVVDLPPESSMVVWEQAARLLPRKRRGLRLIIGGRPRETTALAGQWLSERLGRTIIAPDGSVLPGAGGTLFVDSGWGTGWMRFQPGKLPKLDGKRFPRPQWEEVSALVDVMPTSAGGVAEPLPGGVWLRPRGPEEILRPHRRQLIETVPCQPGVCVVVIGCAGAPPVTMQDVLRFWSWTLPSLRDKLRFVKFGPITVPGGDTHGQAIADALGEEIVCLTGVPVGSRFEPDIYTVRLDGGLGWRSMVEEVLYRPGEPGQQAAPPVLARYRRPFIGIDEIRPAVYQYSPHVVLEVVQSGLWLRPPHEVGHAAAVRSAEPDAARHLVLFEEGEPHLRELAEDVIGRLDHPTRQLSRLVRADSLTERRIEIRDRTRDVAQAPLSVSPDSAHEHVAREEVLSLDTVTMRFDGVMPAQVTPMPAFGQMNESESPEAEEHEAPYNPFEMPNLPIALPEIDTPAPAVSFETAEPPILTRLVETREAEVPVVASDRPGTAASPVVTEEPAPVKYEPVDVTGHTPLPVIGDDTVAEPREAAFVSALQPTPATSAAALITVRGMDEERAWLRRTLSREYAAMSNSVMRVLSEHPGFQGAIERSGGEVLTDAVAIRLYLSEQGDNVDLPLRTGLVGPHVPLARCVVSGLSRLPSHRGATTFAASPTPREWEIYRDRQFITEWGFVNALTAPCARQQAEHDVDVLLWSMTARRTKLLEPESPVVSDRVLFVPGTSFKVLDLVEPKAGQRGLVLLRELAAGEIDENGQVDTNRASLDELAVNTLRRQIDTHANAAGEVRVPLQAAPRFGTLPGLVRTIRQEEGR